MDNTPRQISVARPWLMPLLVLSAVLPGRWLEPWSRLVFWLAGWRVCIDGEWHRLKVRVRPEE